MATILVRTAFPFSEFLMGPCLVWSFTIWDDSLKEG